MEIKHYTHKLKLIDKKNNEIIYSFDDTGQDELMKILGSENQESLIKKVTKKFGKKIDRTKFESWLHENKVSFQMFTWQLVEQE